MPKIEVLGQTVQSGEHTQTQRRTDATKFIISYYTKATQWITSISTVKQKDTTCFYGYNMLWICSLTPPRMKSAIKLTLLVISLVWWWHWLKSPETASVFPGQGEQSRWSCVNLWLITGGHPQPDTVIKKIPYNPGAPIPGFLQLSLHSMSKSKLGFIYHSRLTEVGLLELQSAPSTLWFLKLLYPVWGLSLSCPRQTLNMLKLNVLQNVLHINYPCCPDEGSRGLSISIQLVRIINLYV